MLARTLINLGALDRETGNDLQARARLNEAIAIGRKIHDRGGEAEALAELSRVDLDQSNYVAAHQRAEEALTALESVRLAIASPALRASFFASAREIQELNIEALMRLHADRPAEGFGAAALSASERARARSLLELLSESGTEILQGVDAGLLDQERELELRLSAKAGAAGAPAERKTHR